MYENIDPANLDKAINKLSKKTTVYFIGFVVFFAMAFFYSITINVFYTALVGFIFMGFLLIYHQIGYVFLRLLRFMRFDGNFINDFLNSDDCPEIIKDAKENIRDSKQDRKEIPELK